jgi:UDPglucose 6-dehydrogenase
MKISVVGAGYVGLTSAAGLAQLGHDVVCIDTDNKKVDLINKGISPLAEEGLADALNQSVTIDMNLRASFDYNEIPHTDITLICVGTPSNSDGSINLASIKDASERIAKALVNKNGYHIVAPRSTIIPGTTKRVILPLLTKYSGKKISEDIGICYNPEFLQEGKALKAFFYPDRIILGELDKRAGNTFAQIFSDISAPVFRTDITTAEMIKYASNAFLATKISFINEIGNICSKFGVDVYDVVKGLSFDYRIGDKFLSAGIGFGGSCLPKDLKALVHASSTIAGYRPQLLRAVLNINEVQAIRIVQIAEQKLGDLNGKTISVLGLAFKPGTDDVRDAPSKRIIDALIEKGAKIKAYDPCAMDNAKPFYSPEIEYCRSVEDAINDSDCILIVTEWDEFRREKLFRGKTVIDGRRALDPRKAKAVCDYQGVCW